jgi:hypothetical protein
MARLRLAFARFRPVMDRVALENGNTLKMVT